jgi:hypothetical protein
VKDKIELGLLANGGSVWNHQNCECDPDTGSVPCRYCAIHNALIYARTLAAQGKEMVALLDRMPHRPGCSFCHPDCPRCIWNVIRPRVVNNLGVA